jgi:rapamycin-insensitive companion of mTOR
VRHWGPTKNSTDQTTPLGHPPIHNSNKTQNNTTTCSSQNNDILKAVIKLGNTVLSNKAAADLNSLKMRKVSGLRSTVLFQKVLAILSSHRYKLPACRFVLDLFDRSVLRRLVLEEEDDDDDDGEEGNGDSTFEGAFGGGVGGV